MSEIDWTEVERALESATPGPWVQSMPDTTWVMAGKLHVATIPRAIDGDWSPANATLIALAPYLAAWALEARKKLEAAEELVASIEDDMRKLAFSPRTIRALAAYRNAGDRDE